MPVTLSGKSPSDYVEGLAGYGKLYPVGGSCPVDYGDGTMSHTKEQPTTGPPRQNIKVIRSTGPPPPQWADGLARTLILIAEELVKVKTVRTIKRHTPCPPPPET
jgi:hypothetical protein